MLCMISFPFLRLQMPSYDLLHNLTGRNISDYLIKTRDDFYKRR